MLEGVIMIDNKEAEEYKVKEPQDKIYKIIFEKKNTRAHIQLVIKLCAGLIAALLIGGVFSNLIIKYKYGAIIEQLQKSNLNTNMVILDYNYLAKSVEESTVVIGDSIEALSNNEYNENNLTGVIISSEGSIITNYQGIKDMDKIYLKLCNGTEKVLKAEVIITNEEIDCAILKVKYSGKLTPITMAKDENVNVGQGIAVVGNYLADDKIDSVSPGIIISKNEKDKYSILELSAPVVNGTKGGIICNAKGELVGIATTKLDSNDNYLGVQLVEIESLISSNDLIKSVLGITDGDILIDENSEYKGFYIEQLEKDGNSYKAGIKPTDILLTIDGLDVVSMEKVTRLLQGKKKGDILNCTVLSNGEVKKVDIKLNN